MAKHSFGGLWTRKKLEVLEAYLSFYLKALKNTPFKLHYADAFAGTGTHSLETDDRQTLLIPEEDFKGSVLTALDLEASFNCYHFNELNPEHIGELELIKENYPDKQINICQKDANQFVPEFCAALGRSDRAVLLLDPYSTQLDWNTLKAVANCEKVDLWLLFPISVILRMTPTDGARVKPEWKRTIDRLLGTNDWESALYKPVELPPIDDMFGTLDSDSLTSRVNTEELEKWVSERLNKLFPYVAKPLPLKNRGNTLFLFYFAVANKNPKAWGLADRAASHILDSKLNSE